MRSIPAQLLLHKSSSATTLCNLMRIETQDGEVLGMTNLNRDVVYNDGRGEVVYRAAVGFQPSSIYSSSEMGVDNAEFQALVPEFDFDLKEERINSGVYNYARFWMYEVNYSDTSMGHWEVMSGTLGEMKSQNDITLFGEMRSLLDQMRKPITELDSVKCRAIFGSQPGEERFPCGFNAKTLWKPGAITAILAEVNRAFVDSERVEPNGQFEPGLIRFLSGKNAGYSSEIEESFADGRIFLSFPAPYPFEIGDTYEIREDCNKRARDDKKGCKKWFGAEWINRYRGEPDIPLGDSGSIATPGAGVGPGSGGSIHEDFGNDQD